MSTETVITTKRPEIVSDLVDSLGDVLAGVKPDRHGIKDVFWSAFAFSLAESVHRAFLVKSAHGQDDLGSSWPDHDPKTKAYSRKEGRAGLALHQGKPTKWGNKYRPTLTKEQDKVWRGIYAGQLAYNRAVMGERAAIDHAAESAWAYVKKVMGAKTILDYTKNKILLLLQRSGRLEKSLRPGTLSAGKYHPPADQVFRISQEGLTWGTGVEYAERVNKKRPLWPPSIDPWMREAVEAGIVAIVKRLKEVL